VSAAEVARAVEAVPAPAPGGALFAPSSAPRAEYEDAFARGCTVTVDNVEALRRWPSVFRGRAAWLRLDLGRGDGHHRKVRTGGSEAKFGLPVQRLPEFLEAATALELRITGLHA